MEAFIENQIVNIVNIALLVKFCRHTLSRIASIVFSSESIALLQMLK